MYKLKIVLVGIIDCIATSKVPYLQCQKWSQWSGFDTRCHMARCALRCLRLCTGRRSVVREMGGFRLRVLCIRFWLALADHFLFRV